MENTHIDKIREFVNEHLTDEFSLSEIAGYVGYSAFHLAREFKAITGVSIMEYTRDQRVLGEPKNWKRIAAFVRLRWSIVLIRMPVLQKRL